MSIDHSISPELSPSADDVEIARNWDSLAERNGIGNRSSDRNGVTPLGSAESPLRPSLARSSLGWPSPLPVGPPSNTRFARLARRAGFFLLNAWLVYHLAAIVIAPWSVPPSSRLIQNAWRGVGAYVQLLFLNHGYHYFAPEPGNSTLVAYVLEMPDGRTETGKIPNRDIKPRLFYHRHFMLTEQLGSGDALRPEVRKELVRAMARELCLLHGAKRVTLSQVTHRLPPMEWIRAGGTLDDPKSYVEEPLGTFSCDAL